MNQQPQFNMVVPFTKTVKYLVIANVAMWVGLVLILQNLILGGTPVFDLFALNPERVLYHFWIWQPFTYMFLHASGVFHVLFNMLVLWWFGGELENRWGSRFFLAYYLTCGVGAGLIYLVCTTGWALVTGDPTAMRAPLVGASGATYGLLLAYGILFGERVIYFMMLFPMKAKYFVLIIGIVEMVTLLDSGLGSSVSNLAHLGGIGVGYLTLLWVARRRADKSGGGAKRGRRLRLVVNNERKDEPPPKYWN